MKLRKEKQSLMGIIGELTVRLSDREKKNFIKEMKLKTNKKALAK